MITKIALISISALAILTPIRHAGAIEPLSTAELASHCEHYPKDPNGADAIFCIRYIQGFIDGAIATDERVAQNVAAESSSKETFSERAARTRAQRIKRYGPTYYAEFCLGAPLQLKTVVTKIAEDFKKRKVLSEQLPAREAVYQILRKEYPCVADDKSKASEADKKK